MSNDGTNYLEAIEVNRKVDLFLTINSATLSEQIKKFPSTRTDGSEMLKLVIMPISVHFQCKEVCALDPRVIRKRYLVCIKVSSLFI